MNLFDDNFVKDLPRQFCQRWWELQVAWHLKNTGCFIEHRAKGPDFICTKNGSRFYVEAVACECGVDLSSDSVQPPKWQRLKPGETEFIGPQSIPECERREILRFRNSIGKKTTKYRAFLVDADCGVDADVPYVLAISPIRMVLEARLVGSWNMPSICKAVYGVGATSVVVGGGGGELSEVRTEHRPEVRKTETSSPVNANVFAPDGGGNLYDKISGILYSETNFRICDYPYADDALREEFVFCHNANAQNEVAKGLVGAATEYRAEKTHGGYVVRREVVS